MNAKQAFNATQIVVTGFTKWLFSQQAMTVLVVLQMAIGGAAGWHVLQAVVPKHIELIQSGYEKLSDDNRAEREKLASEVRQERHQMFEAVQRLQADCLDRLQRQKVECE